MSSASTCANCSKAGDKRCSRCSSVFYCSGECQKAHYPSHKAECKLISQKTGSPPSSPSRGLQIPIVSDAQQALAKLTALKEGQNKALNNNDPKGAIEFGKQALALALQLKGPALNAELASLYHTLAMISLQMNKLDDAEEYGSCALKYSETDLKVAADNPRALELHSNILVGEAQRKWSCGKLELAEKPALKALEIAEEVFGSDDPRLVKALRACAAVREQQKNDREACDYLKRAYFCVFNSLGYFNQQTQMILDTYIQMLMKKNDISEALALTEDHYAKHMSTKGPNDPMTAICSNRLTQIFCRLGRLDEAEQLAMNDLRLREAAVGDSHIALVPHLFTIANIREQKKIYDESTEIFLRRALSILRESQPSESPDIREVLVRLSRVAKLRKSGGEANFQLKEDDDLEEFNKLGANPIEKAHFLMSKATQNFQENKFSDAEKYLTEAHKIFVQKLGIDDKTTKMALQNLHVTRNKLIMTLWDEVVEEEIEKARANRASNREDEEDGNPSYLYSR